MSRLPRRWIDDPGFKSVKYHSHSRQEEFFLILEGKAKLRINGRVVRVKTGDFLAKPAGKAIAHQFINDGGEVLRILDCGLEDPDDVATYPDEGAGARTRIRRFFFG